MNVTSRQTNTLAVVSLICGIGSWLVLPLLGAIAAIVTGHIARGEIRRAPERYEGDGLALAGLLLGWINVVVSVLGIVLFLFVFGGILMIPVLFGTGG